MDRMVNEFDDSGGLYQHELGFDAKWGEPWQTFFRMVRAGKARVLMLDYDGTLAPFVVERSKAKPYPSLIEPLRDIAAEGSTRMVVVTGRPALEIWDLLPLYPRPEVFGCHGLERLWPDGRRVVGQVPDDIRDLFRQEADFFLQQGFGDMVELKASGVAVHWRGRRAPVADRACKLSRERFHGLLEDMGDRMAVLDFACGLELRFRGATKAAAVRAILAELEDQDAGSPAIAYLGDDTTDEDAFSELGDRGLAILVRERPRPTRAQAHLVPPRDVEWFLRSFLVACLETESEEDG